MRDGLNDSSSLFPFPFPFPMFSALTSRLMSTTARVAPSFDGAALATTIQKAITESKKYPQVHATRRVEHNNGVMDHTTYDGRVWYWEMLRTAYDCVRKDYDSKHIDVINAQKETFNVDDRTNELVYGGVDNHHYIRINATTEPIIVDVLLRNIFMLHRGWSKKWISPYGNAVYGTPMVFVGTRAQLEKIWVELKALRETDDFHNTLDDKTVIDNPMYYFSDIQNARVVKDYEGAL